MANRKWSRNQVVGTVMIAAVIVAFALTLAVKSGKVGIFGTVMEARRVGDLIEEAEAAIEAGDAERFRALFAEDFSYQAVTYRHIEEVGPALLQAISPVSVSTRVRKIEVERVRARAMIDAVARAGEASGLHGRSTSRWRVEFLNRGGEWKIDRVDNLSINNREGYRLDELVRRAGVGLPQY